MPCQSQAASPTRQGHQVTLASSKEWTWGTQGWCVPQGGGLQGARPAAAPPHHRRACVGGFHRVARGWGTPRSQGDREGPSPLGSPTLAPSHGHRSAARGRTPSAALSSPPLHKSCSETGPTRRQSGPGGQQRAAELWPGVGRHSGDAAGSGGARAVTGSISPPPASIPKEGRSPTPPSRALGKAWKNPMGY